MSFESTPRRSFLGRLMGMTMAVSLPWDRRVIEASSQSAPDDWLGDVTGDRKCFFDFPNYKQGFPLVHIFNYINTYASAYGVGNERVGTVGTFYGGGPASSIFMGFNDEIWSRYSVGEYAGLDDSDGRPYTRNVFNRPTSDDSILLAKGLQSPNFDALRVAMPLVGIERLQEMGTKFIMCNNALNSWGFELEARGKGAAADIDAVLRANLLPGVTVVPAMVIAIEKAQEAGLSYNKQ
ncbi:MAG TPA: hypothetical protein QGH09_07155 [Vicinamibacterales bacterium]|nr:hypothetical protein [Vicinamibacterales bacterium]